MSTALTATGQICKALDQMETSLNDSLKGTGVTVQRFLSTAKTAVQTHADQDRLEKADRNSLYLAIKKAAQDGLMPDNREAALVIYGNKVQYQPMVQGLVKLARNSGEIESIGAYVVYEGDSFSYKAGDQKPDHTADWFGKRGEPIGVWAFVKLKSGEYIDPVMLTKERIDRIATRSKQPGNYNPKTAKDWEEFWKKAAIRNILKYAPRSTALDSALKDDDNEFEMADSISHEPVNPVSDGVKTETAAARVVKASVKHDPEEYIESPMDIITIDQEDESLEIPI